MRARDARATPCGLRTGLQPGRLHAQAHQMGPQPLGALAQLCINLETIRLDARLRWRTNLGVTAGCRLARCGYPTPTTTPYAESQVIPIFRLLPFSD
jgi:hypothetical protein